MNEEALDHWGLSHQKTNKIYNRNSINWRSCLSPSRRDCTERQVDETTGPLQCSRGFQYSGILSGVSWLPTCLFNVLDSPQGLSIEGNGLGTDGWVVI